MKAKGKALCLLLCGALVLPLEGCRFSAVLEQIIYDRFRSHEVDQDPPFHLEENNPDNAETSDDLKDLETDSMAERQTEPAADPLTPTATAEPVPEPDNGAGADTAESEAVAPAETPEPGDGGQGAGGTGEAGTDYEASAGTASDKQVVDAYGKTVDIPADVDRVAATGQLALMTLILGGADRLAATDGELTQTGYDAAIFDGIAQAEVLWSQADSALSDSAFQRLLELAPDVVLETSGSAALTDQQAAALEAADISYLVLPAPTSITNIKTIMTTLGTVLGDRSDQGGSNAPQVAAAYNAWVDQVIRTVSQATAAYAAYSDDETGVSRSATYTLYVDGWDSQASYRLYSEQYTTLSGTGCAVIRNGATNSCKAVTDALSYAHVVNTAAQYGIVKKALYFTPLISAYRTMEVTGTMAEGMVTAGQKLLEQGGESLGTAGFPILLAADQATAASIAASELWQVYPHINSGDGSFNSDGFLDEEGNLVRTQISGSYEIAVNPSGLSSWTEGGCESILEAVWAAWLFFDAISETDMRNYITDFYGTFYGCTLSEQALDTILEGEAGG